MGLLGFIGLRTCNESWEMLKVGARGMVFRFCIRRVVQLAGNPRRATRQKLASCGSFNVSGDSSAIQVRSKDTPNGLGL